MNIMDMNNSQDQNLIIGRAGEYLALADVLGQGVQAFQTEQGVVYDIIIDIDHRLLRCQVKTTRKMKVLKGRSVPVYFFHTKRCGKNGLRKYLKDDFDIYIFVCIENKKVMYLRKEDYKINKNISSVSIRDKEFVYPSEKNGGKIGYYAQELTLENIIKFYEKNM